MRSLWNIILILVAGCASQKPQPASTSAIMPPAPATVIRQSRIAQSAIVTPPAPARTFTITSTILTVIQSSGDLVNWQNRITGKSLTVAADKPQEFFRANPDLTVVHVAWDPSPDASVTGYKIYSGGETREYREVIDVGNVTNAIITIAAHPTNYLAATCYDASGMESDFSNEAVWVNPTTVTLKIQ